MRCLKLPISIRQRPLSRARLPACLPPHMQRPSSTQAYVRTVKVQGSYCETEPDHKQLLNNQLNRMPSDIKSLRIKVGTPSKTEWNLLGTHFPHIEDLTLDFAGLDDSALPLTWPLARLEVKSANAEVFQSKQIRKGLIPHLVLNGTSGMRFEGPTSSTLREKYIDQVESDVPLDPDIPLKGLPSERPGDGSLSVPGFAAQWLWAKYDNPEHKVEKKNHPSPRNNLRMLDILGNDAMETFTRFFVALPHLALGVSSLKLHSTGTEGFPRMAEFTYWNEELLRQALPQLTKLRHLRWTVGDVFTQPSSLPNLYKWFPEDLKTLHFRAPASLVQTAAWEDWVRSFSSPEYLPNLKRLSFVLDLHYPFQEDGSIGHERPAPDDLLQEARAQCERLYEGVRERGIIVEPLHEEWAGFREVDSRWLS